MPVPVTTSVRPALAKPPSSAEGTRMAVRGRRFRPVGGALLWTLEQGLGEGWTRDVEDAWIAVYTLLADTMKKAAERRIGILA